MSVSSAASVPSARGLALLGGAVAFGITVDTLDEFVPGRLNAALGAGTLVVLAAALAQREDVEPRANLAPLAPVAGLLCAAMIWRDSATLFALNLIAFVLLVALAAPAAAGRPGRIGLGDAVRGAGQTALAAGAGAMRLVAGDVEWRAISTTGRWGRARAAAVGLAAVTPVLVLFGALLAAADPVFGRLLERALVVDPERVVAHVAMIGIWSWLVAGVLRLAFVSDSRPAADEVGGRGRWGIVEIGTALAAVDLLFLAFVAVQLRYLFGGSAYVQQLTGITYAEYARRGFFELVTVSALSLPLLLVADWWLDPRDRAGTRRFRILAGLMLVLLDVMLVSALQRMRLYTAEFGLTELRLYTTAFMGWVAVVLGWFAATVLRGRRHRFFPGALGAAALALGALNLLNPDAIIARTNLERAAVRGTVDTWYLSHLSADAVPTLLDGVPRLPASLACALDAAVQGRWADGERADRWTLGLESARRRLAATPAYRCGS